ncbi:MAG: acyl-CoA thioesterase [Chloroflexi bacterium]|nr:acyl-CoA thioesterase [Chloroflexota bacterium]MBV9547815.1 acyl-CoA thioesterase [Chloroflexota bacterium]
MGVHLAVEDLQLAQVMLPQDANPHGNVHGGTLMKLADTAGGLCAMRHARRPLVTVVMDSMTFEEPVYVGNLVLLHACVTWTGRTSVETVVTIDAEDVVSGMIRHISSAYFVYVAIDDDGRPSPVPPFEPKTAEQRARWKAAEQRRAIRLGRRTDGVHAQA